MPLAPSPPPIDFRLGYKLRRVAAHLRAIRFHRQGAVIWTAVTLVAALLLAVQHRSPALAPFAAPILFAAFAFAAVLASWLAWRDRIALADAARAVEQQHPDLRTALLAAAEQNPADDGQFTFLQRRVIDNALRHADTHDWARRPRRHARWLLAAHATAALAALGVSILVIQAHRPATARLAAFAAGLEITPGDIELERGSAVVIAARFGTDAVPSDAVLVWQPAGAAAQRAPMHRSLSDPVFASTLAAIAADTSYHIEYDGGQSRSFTLTVFDRPALLRADAALDYPDYTGLADRRFADTRRVTAVAGTRLDYEFTVNKPLARATLRATDEREFPLEAIDATRTRFRFSTTLGQSQRLALHLLDDDNRTAAAPVDFRIEVLENRRPELKLTFPRGDRRVSPIEELHLQAEARDDFGLLDYGFGISVADTPPAYLSLAAPPAGDPPRPEAAFNHLLALESHGVKPDQLVTWFAWADDRGPEGEVRRSTSDVFFAEVRRLDEIFRENATGGGRNQPGGASGGPGEELIETQRQISIAIWKLRQQDPTAPAFADDAGTLRDSQLQALQQLATVRERLEEPSARAAADEAAPLMAQAADALAEAASARSAAPLDAAWSAARGAYQALLRMQSRDTSVSQSSNNGQGGSSSRGRDQLDQLEFRHEQDRYETETQAQPPPTPEEREQLQVLARLRELARRQQDLNDRLQELQTALAAAQDEAERERIRRELKRLEDEQRRMLSDLDETRQRVDRMQPGQQTQDARQQLEQTRDDMRRATEQLQQGEVSQALAAGTRAQENLQRTGEDLRQEAAGRFGEQMREARRQARELTENQKESARQLDDLSRGAQKLDDSAEREAVAQTLEEQARRRDALLDTLRQITEDSEGTEPRLHRQLYDLLRQQGQSGVGQELATGAELLRRGLVEPVRDRQAPVLGEFEQLQRAVERAAGSVLGDETSELRFAQRELDDLTRELQRDRRDETGTASTPGEQNSPASDSNTSPTEASAPPSLARSGQSGNTPAPSDASTPRAPEPASANRPTGSPGDNAGDADSAESDMARLEQFARDFNEARGNADAARGPLTGAGFGEWAERLRTVEELMESPELRQQLASARFQAEELRRANQQKGEAPRWDLVEMGIVAPLEDARAWLRQELQRREQPDALQPIDRDPVPDRYAESVRKYYEALGTD